MKKLLIVLVILSAVLTFSCARGNTDTMQYGAASIGLRDQSNIYRTRTMQESIASSELSESSILNNFERKLVRSAFITIRVENLEDASASVSALMNRHNAYSASTTIQENSHNYSLRVPSHLYDIFLAELTGMGRLIQRTENTEDVTLRYYDLEGRLQSMRELLRTFQSYLGRANSIEEILSVEARIADLQREIDFIGSQLRNLANRVEYASIDLNILGPVTASLNRGETFGERNRQLFGHFGSFLSTVGIILLGFVVYAVPVLAILALLFLVFFGRIGLMKKLWRVITKK
jgi:hypothetical protein